MPINFPILPDRPLPSRTYGTVILLISAALFTLFGLQMVSKVNNVRTLVKQENTHTAEQELKQSIDFVLTRTADDIFRLANWDEVHHLIKEPVYYAYWKSDRIKASSIIPRYVVSVELYDRSKKLLQTAPDTQLPSSVPNTNLIITKTYSHVYLFRYHPIKSRKHSDKIIGYLGLKIDLLKALKILSNLVYTNPDSLKVNTEKQKNLFASSADILTALSFKPKSNQSSNRLETVMYQYLQLGATLLFIIFILFYIIIIILFTRPLQVLANHIDMLRHGKNSPLTDKECTFHLEEMDTVFNSINSYQSEIDELHNMLSERNLELHNMTLIDPLTGVYNRRAYENDWANIKAMVKGQRMELAFLLFDCDHFKAINDTHGHDVGDQVIKIMAGELSSVLRKGDKLYRIGGDEFAAFLMNTNNNSAQIVAERCIATLKSNPFKSLGISEPVYSSIGYAVANAENPQAIDDLPINADKAMYMAKQSKQHIAVCFNSQKSA